ncbi:MAG TPA: hypothetical protein VF610_12195 [Segetibacter sp.]
MPAPDLKKRLAAIRAFDWEIEAKGIVDRHTQDITELQTEQMRAGKDKNDNWIRPYYSENPFFKSPESAMRYAKWKSHISPNKDKPFNVPDLFIIGTYHNSVRTEVSGDKFKIKGTASFAFSVESVHKDALGLNSESRHFFIEKFTIPEITKILKNKLGVTLSRP